MSGPLKQGRFNESDASRGRPLTGLAFELVIGTPERFHCGKQLASYVGLVPEEKSSGDRRRLGHISTQGNVLLRFLLVEAAQVTVPQSSIPYLKASRRRTTAGHSFST